MAANWTVERFCIGELYPDCPDRPAVMTARSQDRLSMTPQPWRNTCGAPSLMSITVVGSNPQ